MLYAPLYFLTSKDLLFTGFLRTFAPNYIYNVI